MSDPRPASQLLSQVFSEEKLTEYPDLATYLEEGGSIFPLVEKGVQGLVREYKVSPDDARLFLRRANSMAVYLRRQFIEHSLHGKNTESAAPRSGLLSMVEGPSFERLFDPRFDSLCPPDAIESLASSAAYLVEMVRWVIDRIEHFSTGPVPLRLRERRKRPDESVRRLQWRYIDQCLRSTSSYRCLKHSSGNTRIQIKRIQRILSWR